MTSAEIGQPVSRVDGRRKVTGAATYAAEFDVPGVAHGDPPMPSGRRL
jgi:xanthine dehydrogenase YagR molybdenum-binding subunit